jgi:hypothetical protein
VDVDANDPENAAKKAELDAAMAREGSLKNRRHYSARSVKLRGVELLEGKGPRPAARGG